jgi:D-beta-D-heptose 7-phosphate kinase/D-beta-D-heptose 1-phosphate adenosyltransferase
MENFVYSVGYKEAMDNLLTSISEFSGKQILVVGDIMLDRWTYGKVTRLSPEAPVPVLQKTDEKFTLGGAANVAHNLASLGAKTYLAGVVGNDQNGSLVVKLLSDKNITTDAILFSAKRPTTEKHRIVSGDDHQFLRLDFEDTSALSSEEEVQFFERVQPLMHACDAVILSDYAKGVFSKILAQRVIGEAKKYGKIVLADFKPQHKSFFYGADIISPNLKEAQEMTGLHDTQEVGKQLVNDFDSYVVITRGADGMSVFRKGDAEEYYVPGKKIKIFDVSGAGDTAIATLALGLSTGLSVQTAVMLSNEAGAIVVQKPGTATLSPEELASSFKILTNVENVAIVPKLWGYEKWIENNEKYCCKILSLNKGYQCSLHYHKNKDETFVVTSGHVRMELGGEVLHMRPGAFVRVPPNTPHRFTGMENSLIMEVSTHHEESDSYRIEESRKVELLQFV